MTTEENNKEPECFEYNLQADYLNEFAKKIGFDVNAPAYKNGEISSPQTESWEKEFDELTEGYMYEDGGKWTREDIKSFIHKLLASKERELREKVR